MILKTAAVPYGVTLTVWASGAALAHFRGGPSVFDIFLFVFGGMAGYTVVALAVIQALEHSGPASPGAEMALTGLLHLVSIGVAVGAVTLVAQIQSWAAWPLGGFAGIGLYLALVGVEFLIAPRLTPRPKALPDEDR
jgi:hypothetical protein